MSYDVWKFRTPKEYEELREIQERGPDALRDALMDRIDREREFSAADLRDEAESTTEPCSDCKQAATEDCDFCKHVFCERHAITHECTRRILRKEFL